MAARSPRGMPVAPRHGMTNDKPTPNPNLHPVVVGIDFDEQGINAVKHAIGMATMGMMEAHVCHVVVPRPEIDVSAQHMKVRFEELVRFVKPHVPKALDERMRLHLVVGDPSDALVQLAVDVDAELIVVGTHDKPGVMRLVQGSVASELLRKAPCPVLVAVPRRAAQSKVPVRYGEHPVKGTTSPYRMSVRGLAAVA
jgi:nucleotide-binding universal stress UspA family protein